MDRDYFSLSKERFARLEPHLPGAGNIARYQRQGVKAAMAKAAERLSLVADDLRKLSAEGLSLNAMAGKLNGMDIRTSRGRQWTATAVRRAVLRLA